MATHSSILAWKILWTEEYGGLQFMGWQRVGHDWAPEHSVESSYKIRWYLMLSLNHFKFLASWGKKKSLIFLDKHIWFLKKSFTSYIFLKRYTLVRKWFFKCYLKLGGMFFLLLKYKKKKEMQLTFHNYSYDLTLQNVPFLSTVLR